MKKNKICLFLASVIVTSGLLAGCGGSTAPAPAPAPAETPSTEAPAETPSGETPAASTTSYPEKNIQVIIGYAPGGDSDLNGRLTMKHLEQELGKQLIAVNTEGASGGTATRKVKDSPADGYTVYFTQISLMMNYALGTSDLTYSDFETAGMICLDEASVLLVNSSSPYQTLEDVIAAAKANPGQIMYSSAMGSDTSLRVKLLEREAGVKFNEVDTGGTSARVTALLGEQVEMMSVPYGSVKDYVETGQFRVLGVYGNERLDAIPDVPTFPEMGYDVIVPKYFFYVFPKGTPDEYVDRFNEAIKTVCESPEMQEELWKYYVKPVHMSREETTKLLGELQDEYIELLATN